MRTRCDQFLAGILNSWSRHYKCQKRKNPKEYVTKGTKEKREKPSNLKRRKIVKIRGEEKTDSTTKGKKRRFREGELN